MTNTQYERDERNARASPMLIGTAQELVKAGAGRAINEGLQEMISKLYGNLTDKDYDKILDGITRDMYSTSD